MMDFVRNMAGLGYYLLLLPLFLGRFLWGNGKKTQAAAWYVWGMFFLMALFEVAAVPLILLHRPLHEAIWGWNLLIAAAAAVFVIKHGTVGKGLEASDVPWKKGERLLLCLVLLLLAIQCCAYLFGMHVDDDDSRYVANAVAAFETDTMYRYHPNNGEVMTYFMGEVGKETASPMMMFYAAVSYAAGIHPTIMIHTVWPVVWLIVSCGIFWMISLAVYPPEKRESRLLFLLFVMLLNIWGNTSIYTSSTFSLIRLWQGKALVPALFAPMLFFLMLYRAGGHRKNWYRNLVVCNLAACLCSGMGIFLSAALTLCIAAALAFYEKNWKVLPGCFLCCIPNACYTFLYLLVHRVILR